MTAFADEREAAELEGLFELDANSDIKTILMVEKFKTLRAQKAKLLAEMDEVKNDLLKDITDRGAQALVLDGHVIARRSEVTTTSVDTTKLKALAPEVYAAVLRVTKSIRFTAPEKKD